MSKYKLAILIYAVAYYTVDIGTESLYFISKPNFYFFTATRQIGYAV